MIDPTNRPAVVIADQGRVASSLAFSNRSALLMMAALQATAGSAAEPPKPKTEKSVEPAKPPLSLKERKKILSRKQREKRKQLVLDLGTEPVEIGSFTLGDADAKY